MWHWKARAAARSWNSTSPCRIADRSGWSHGGSGPHSPFCGSGLAREDGGTFNINVSETPLSRASPLSQGQGPSRRWRL
ncbi:hypothetical protein DZG01_17500 [Pseudomonas fluorescens]|nr:hypothetical protein DZG01_17500 [Pseudomonas fluorescens]